MLPKVLVINDTFDIQSMLSARFWAESVQLVTATDFESGLRRARADRPDVVLIDVDLAGARGLELCRTLKCDEATANIPVILLTSSNDVMRNAEAFELGALDYVSKPVHAAELRARLRAALRMKRMQDMLSLRALVDAVTGLRNRSYLDQRLESEIRRVRDAAQSVALVLFDIDRFTYRNETHGRPFGDYVLQRVAEEAGRVVRADDAACRFGGDTFALILANTAMTGGVAAAERLRERIQRLSFSTAAGKAAEVVQVTASFGVACAAEVSVKSGRAERRQLIECAEEALAAAKRGGANRVHAYRHQPSMPPPMRKRVVVTLTTPFVRV